MGKFKIKVYYSTGDSFRNEDTTDLLEISWDDLGIAKENLQAIKEHYEMYRELDSYRTKNHQEVFEKNSNKNWFVGEKSKLFIGNSDDKYSWWCIDNTPENREKFKDLPHEFRFDWDESKYCMKLKADNGNYMRQRNFWCGYFEHLHSVEIIADTDDFKIYF